MAHIEESIAASSGFFGNGSDAAEKIGSTLPSPKGSTAVESFLKRIKKRLGEFFSKENRESVFIPLDVLKSIKNAPHTNDGDILVFEELNLSTDELRYLIHFLGPAYGPEEISFPSPPEKVLYLASLDNPKIYPIPEYRHSCPDIDRILMGLVPYTNFLDTSRAGLAMLMPKAFEYARRSSDKYVNEGNQIDYKKMDKTTEAFIREFGLISCIPITDRRTLFNFANKNDLEIASIGGSSIAECFYAACRIFGNLELKEQVSKLAGGGWLNGKDRDGTSKLTAKFLQYFSQYYSEQYQLLNFEKTPDKLNKYLLEKYPNSPHPHIQFLADVMMEMVKKYTILPNDKKRRERAWKIIAYGNGPHLERVSTKDVSEIVVSGSFSRERNPKRLPPMPWRSFVLFPHARYDQEGREIAKFATMDQLVKAAELIKKYYPDAIIFIPTKDNQPIGYNIEEEKKVKNGEILSSTNAMLAVIAHFTTSPSFW